MSLNLGTVRESDTQTGGLPVDEVVQTPLGPRTVGELDKSSKVLGGDGRSRTVLNVRRLGEQEIFKIAFTDGTSLRTTSTQPWQILSHGWSRTVDTEWLMTHKLERQSGWSYRIPPSGLAYYEQAELPLNPYVLGALLGDGSFRERGGATLTGTDPVVFDEVRSNLPEGDTLRVTSDKRNERVLKGYIGRNRKRSMTREALEAFGLWGLRSENKFIPPPYLVGSVEQRLALLQGLMDTDGWTPSHTNTIAYSTSSPQLRDDFTTLIWSLGGIATWKTKKDPRYQNGFGLDHFQGRICLPNDVLPYRGQRGLALRDRSFGLPRRYVTSVEPDGTAEAANLVLVDGSTYLVGRQLALTGTPTVVL